MAYFADGLIFKDKYLGVLIAYFILKIILKERQERKQQRLQENAVSPAPASDAVLDGESGGDEALEPADPSGTERACLLPRGALQQGQGWARRGSPVAGVGAGTAGEHCSRGGCGHSGGVGGSLQLGRGRGRGRARRDSAAGLESRMRLLSESDLPGRGRPHGPVELLVPVALGVWSKGQRDEVPRYDVCGIGWSSELEVAVRMKLLCQQCESPGVRESVSRPLTELCVENST